MSEKDRPERLTREQFDVLLDAVAQAARSNPEYMRAARRELGIKVGRPPVPMRDVLLYYLDGVVGDIEYKNEVLGELFNLSSRSVANLRVGLSQEVFGRHWGANGNDPTFMAEMNSRLDELLERWPEAVERVRQRKAGGASDGT